MGTTILIFALLALGLVLLVRFLIKQNQKDQKELEEYLDKDDSDTTPSDKTD